MTFHTCVYACAPATLTGVMPMCMTSHHLSFAILDIHSKIDCTSEGY